MTSDKIIVREEHRFDGEDTKAIFEDSTSFSQWIERRSIRERISCMTLILDFCERRSLDVDEVADLITRPLKEKIKKEMIESGLMKKKEASFDDF